MFNIGFGELLIVIILVLLVADPKDIPKFAAKAGQKIQELKLFLQNFHKHE